MPDPRVTKLAQVLVNYSLDLQPGEEFALETSPLAEDLNLAVFKEAILAGAHVTVHNTLPGEEEIFFKYASHAQLDYIPPMMRLISEQLTAYLYIEVVYNTRELSAIDPARQNRLHKARAGIMKTHRERTARHEAKWSYTVYPTNALAQEAGMSLSEYQDFVYSAGLLDLPDPAAAWKKEGERQRELIHWLADRDRVMIKGGNIDLQLSIQGRSFLESSGKENFPGGEIFTSPLEQSANGWVRFAYPAIHAGQEVTDIELWLEDGKIVKEKAGKGQELLTAVLNTDNGSRYLGEWGIGTNYGIRRFTKNMLFDEKMGGTIHFAVGFGFPEAGGQNDSGIHWDMLCDMSESEITVDGDLFYKDGQVVV